MALRFKDFQRLFRVPSDGRVRLKKYDPAWTGRDEFRDLREDELKARAAALLQKNLGQLSAAQERLYANDVHSVLIVLQAMDAAGKDGTIKHVMSGVNPQGCQVFSFKQPTAEDLDHNFLWRYMKALPERGRIGIFNRSYYEDVLVVRVHPKIIEGQPLPPGPRGDKFWADRYDDINQFERHLVRNGTLVLKFFLHLSKKEQKRRFLSRLDSPEKRWKFSASDVKERQHWDKYQEVFEQMLRNTSTKWAPWWVIPADHKWVTRALVAAVVTDAIEDLKLKFPTITPEKERQLAEARRQLDGDPGATSRKRKKRSAAEPSRRAIRQEKTPRPTEEDQAPIQLDTSDGEDGSDTLG